MAQHLVSSWSRCPRDETGRVVGFWCDVQLSFSVIIPARDAAAVLPECLKAIARRPEGQQQRVVTATTSLDSTGGIPLEVIVADDGSTDATAAEAEAFGARLVRPVGRGPAAARNAGARAASGDLLVFLDADCVAEEGCFEALLEPFADPEVAGSRGGYTSTQRALLARFVQLEMEEKQARLAESGQATLLDTACAAFRRGLFLAQGGFDEGLPATSAEDAELSFRLTSLGYRLVYAPQARVQHRHPEQMGSYLRRKLRFGYYRALLYRRYPARMRNDGYTPRLMPMQILLSGALAAAVVAGGWIVPARPVAVVVGLLFLATALPLAARAWRKDRWLAIVVPPLLLARSLAQGTGLLAGIVSLLVAPVRSTVRHRGRRPEVTDPAGRGPGGGTQDPDPLQ